MDTLFRIQQAEKRRLSLPEPYNMVYEWGEVAARRNELIVVKSRTSRNYGYELENRATKSRAMWFRYKRDAIKKINVLKG